jgi:succinate-semialdehyde dehydrogenase/glutarate-semialdehyde dehydrogenase
MNQAAARLHEQANNFARLATLKMGKRIDEALDEANFSGNVLAYYAKNAGNFLAPVALNPEHGEAHLKSSPHV